MKKLLNYFHPLSRLERERIEYLENPALPSEINSLLSEPYPAPDTRLSELNYLVLDLETTGLDPMEDRILSVGYLQIHGFLMNLKTSVHTYIQEDAEIKPESAVVNHIVPEMLSEGEPLDAVMTRLFEQMQGKLVIAHGTIVEKRFIDQYLSQRYGLPPLPLLWLDTMLMEKYRLFNNPDGVADYRLASVREQNNLPPYLAHNALADSIATGELFLALVKQIFGQTEPKLGRIFRPIS